MSLVTLMAGALTMSTIAPLEHEVTFRHGGVTLAGTLSLPSNGQVRWPLAVFISGDGPQTRDGVPGAGDLVTALRAALLDSGIAVLRHDDRGAGTRPVLGRLQHPLDDLPQPERQAEQVGGRQVLLA